MKKIVFTLAVACLLATCGKQNKLYGEADRMNKMNKEMSKCENDLWDKVFPLSEKVTHKKVSFPTQYGITLVADLYAPKSVSPQDGL